MVAGVLGGVTVVGLFWDAEGKTEALVGAGGDVAESEGSPAGRGVDEGKLVGEFLPRAFLVLEGELAKEIGEAGNREGFLSFVFEGVKG